MTDSTPDDMTTTPPALDVSMTPAEAAARLGISERTVQRRLKQGTLYGYKIDTGRGEVWRVVLDGMGDTPPVQPDVMPAKATSMVDVTTSGVTEFAHAVIDELRQEYRDELERLRRDNQQLAGQVGYLQRQVVEQQETIQRLLAAPTEEPELTDVTPQAPSQADSSPDWQAIAQALEERVKRLEEPPVEPEASAAPEQPRRSWWRRLLGE